MVVTPLSTTRARWLRSSVKFIPGVIWLPYIAVALLFAGAMAVHEWSTGAVRSGGERIVELVKVERDFGGLWAAVVAVEAAQRGYTITHDSDFLETFYPASHVIGQSVSALQSRERADAAYQNLVATLEVLASRKIAFCEKIIDLERTGRHERAVKLIETGEGKIIMDAFRRVTDEALVWTSGRLRAASEAQSDNIRRSQIASIAIGFVATTLLVLLLRSMIRQGARQAARRQELEALVKERTRDLFQLATHLQNVQEREKADLARNLHDELGGLMTAARMDLTWVQDAAPPSDAALKQKLSEIAAILDEAMGIKRRVVEGLRPALLEHFGPKIAVSTYVEENCLRAGITSHVEIDDDFDQASADIAVGLFRVIQESLTNTMRHASAQRFDLQLVREGEHYRVTISDDGRGLPRNRRQGAHGLVGLRHRVLALGGIVDIHSDPGYGVRISIQVPRVPPSNDELSAPTADGLAYGSMASPI